MSRWFLTVFSLTIGLLLLSEPISAHHSFLEYDREHLTTIKGTVSQFEFINPHVLIHFDVKNDQGAIEQWFCFGGSPDHMTKIGWTPDQFKAGDQLTITGLRFKDGRDFMLFLKIVRPNGERVPISDAEEFFLRPFEGKAGKQPE